MAAKRVFLIDRFKALKSKKDLDTAVKDMWIDFFNDISNRRNELHNPVIFVHNIGKFDGIFIFQALIKYFDSSSLKTILDDEKSFIQITVTIKGQIITFKESYRIFPVGLNDLCKIFNVDGKLQPYNRIFQSTRFFDNKKLLDNFISYGLRDSTALFQCLEQAHKIYLEKYNVDIASIVSTSTLSLKILRRNFLKTPIPILKSTMDKFIRQSYFGGCTDCYIRYGKKIKHYDVNSLYPYAMLKPMPYEFIRYHNENIDLLNFFGFIKAEIICPDSMKRPILPLKHNGKTIYPTGNWTGVSFSEELKACLKLGYIVKPISGFEFSKFNPFKEYIEHFYDLKKNSSGAVRFIAKMHLNQLYGYFGRKFTLIETVIVNTMDFFDISHKYAVKNWYTISPDKHIVLKHANMDHELFKDLNLQLNLDQPLDNDFKIGVKSNVAIGSAVTSYARIHMIPFKLNPKTMYTDTDCAFVMGELDACEISKELGMMKDELEGKFIEEGYFLGQKQYGFYYIDENNIKIEISVWAGVPRNHISFEDIVKLSNGGELNCQIPNKFFRSFANLSIDIKDINLTIRENNDKILVNNEYLPPHVNLDFKDPNLNMLNSLKNKFIKLLNLKLFK